MTHWNPGLIWAIFLVPSAAIVYGTHPALTRTWTKAADRRAMRRVCRRDLACLDQAEAFNRAFGEPQ